MKKLILALALFLPLAGCGGGTDRATQIQADITKACGIVVSVKDIAAVIAASVNPAAGVAVTGIGGIAKVVCDQWAASRKIHALVASDCVATVNGVCIHKQ